MNPDLLIWVIIERLLLARSSCRLSKESLWSFFLFRPDLQSKPARRSASPAGSAQFVRFWVRSLGGRATVGWKAKAGRWPENPGAEEVRRRCQTTLGNFYSKCQCLKPPWMKFNMLLFYLSIFLFFLAKKKSTEVNVKSLKTCLVVVVPISC